MELEFPGFVLLLLVAAGLLVFGPAAHPIRDRVDQMAAATAAAQCVGAGEAFPEFGVPAHPVVCTVY